MAAKPEESPAAPVVIPLAAARDPVVEFSGEEEKEGEAREVKRRRTCPPAALQKIYWPPPPAVEEEEEDDEAGCSGRGGFSFSFDTRGIAPIETTPKFGSFNFSADLLALGVAKEGEEKTKNGKVEGEEAKNEGETAS